MKMNEKRLINQVLMAAAIAGIAWLPAVGVAALNTTVNDSRGAHAMSICMLEDGEMHMNGDQVVCCIDRFCVACKDDEDCRIWSNKDIDDRLPQSKQSGGTTMAVDAPSTPPSKDSRPRSAPQNGAQ